MHHLLTIKEPNCG